MKNLFLKCFLLFVMSNGVNATVTNISSNFISQKCIVVSENIEVSFTPVVISQNPDGWGRWLSIVGADIIGAGTGVWAVKELAAAAGAASGGVGAAFIAGGAAVICGGGASYATSKSVHRTINPSNWTVNGDPISNIGNIHNLLLNNYYGSNDSEDVFLSKYFDKNIVENLLNNQEFSKAKIDILSQSEVYSKDYDIIKYISSMEKSNYMSSEMKSFYIDFFAKFNNSQTKEDANGTIEEFKNSLSNGKYDDYTKMALGFSLDVATSSLNFWYEQKH